MGDEFTLKVFNRMILIISSLKKKLVLCGVQTCESVDEILKYDLFERKISSAAFLWCFSSGV